MRPTTGNSGTPADVHDAIDVSSSDEIIDSSSKEIEPKQPPEKGRPARPTLTQRQAAKADEARVAPNSTSHTDPVVSPSGKRAGYQEKLKAENKQRGQGMLRTREADIQSRHPELKALQSAQRKKDFEKANPTLDRAKLRDQAMAAGGSLEVNVKSLKSVSALSDVLLHSPNIKALKLTGNFFEALTRDDLAEIKGLTEADLEVSHYRPNPKSFREILMSGRHLMALDVSQCQFEDAGWRDLADFLKHYPTIQSLSLGPGGSGTASASEELGRVIAASPNLQVLEFRSFLAEDTGVYELFEKAAANPNLRSLKFSEIRTYEGFPFDTLFRFSRGTYGGISQISATGTELKLPDSESDPYFTACCHFAASARSLRVLDLSGCGLSEEQMDIVAGIVQHCPALESIKLDGNEVSDAARASFDSAVERNVKAQLERRESLMKSGAATYELLVNNAAQAPDLWGNELNRALAENAPPEVLESLARMIGENPDSKPPSDKVAPGRADS